MLSAELLEALAASTCQLDSRARRLDEENHSLGTVSWPEALRGAVLGQSYCARVRYEVVALDCDLDDVLDSDVDRALDDVEHQFLSALDEVAGTLLFGLGPNREVVKKRLALIEIAAWLCEQGLSPVVLRSGRPGNRHLFCVVEDAALRAEVWRRAGRGGLDVRKDNSLIRPPGWPHRLGEPVSVAHVGHESFDTRGGATDEVFERVVDALGGPKISASTKRALPARLWELIRYGDRDGRYSRQGRLDRSALTLALCNVAVSHGVHREYVWNLLVKEENVGGAGLRDRIERRGIEGPSGARAWFYATWSKANDGAPKRGSLRDSEEILAEIEKLSVLAGRSSFLGVSGSTDRAVLAAVHSIGVSYRSLYVPLSRRTVSLKAGVSAPTAGRSLKRLRASGWLRLIRTSRQDRAAVYQLSEPAWCAHNVPSDETLGGCRTGQKLRDEVVDLSTSGLLRSVVGHDAFAHVGLGKGCLETLGALSDGEWRSCADVAELTGKHPGTVRRHVSKLREAGLVSDDGAGAYVRTLGGDLGIRLTEVAEALGTAGVSARRAEVYAAERRRYRVWLVLKLRMVLESHTHYTATSTTPRSGVALGATSRRRGPPRYSVA